MAWISGQSPWVAIKAVGSRVTVVNRDALGDEVEVMVVSEFAYKGEYFFRDADWTNGKKFSGIGLVMI
jgi:hypothetical protein